MGQQLVQVARAAGHRVVQHHVVLARPAVLARLVLQHHAQVVHLATEAALQAELHGRHEGLHYLLVDAVLGVRHQDAQRLGFEFAVQVQAVQQIGRVIAAMLRAIEAVVLLGRPSRSARRLLHLATVPAQLEAGARRLPVGHLEGVAWLGQFAEVHVAEGHA